MKAIDKAEKIITRAFALAQSEALRTADIVRQDDPEPHDQAMARIERVQAIVDKARQDTFNALFVEKIRAEPPDFPDPPKTKKATGKAKSGK